MRVLVGAGWRSESQSPGEMAFIRKNACIRVLYIYASLAIRNLGIHSYPLTVTSQSRMDQSATAPTDIERVFSSYIDIRGSRDFPPFSGARYWALELLIRDRLHDCTVGTPREHDAQLGVA